MKKKRIGYYRPSNKEILAVAGKNEVPLGIVNEDEEEDLEMSTQKLSVNKNSTILSPETTTSKFTRNASDMDYQLKSKSMESPNMVYSNRSKGKISV